MNTHKSRILLAGGIAVLVLTALFLLLPKTPLVIAAFCFSLLTPVMFFGTLWMLASGTRNTYLTNAAFPFQSRTYCQLNLLVCGLAVVLELLPLPHLPVPWFCFAHILLLAWFAWRLLAMAAGQEEIVRVENHVRARTGHWKIMVAAADSLKNEAPAEYRDELQNVYEAMRYADPMRCEELAKQEEEIQNTLGQLRKAVWGRKAEEVSRLSQRIQQQVRNRGNCMKMLK